MMLTIVWSLWNLQKRDNYLNYSFARLHFQCLNGTYEQGLKVVFKVVRTIGELLDSNYY